jgi:hypothetical protein
MEDNNAGNNILKKVPSILSVLAFMSGSRLLSFLCFLLNLNNIFKEDRSVSEEPEYVPEKPKFEYPIRPYPIRPMVTIKKRKKFKPRRRTQGAAPQPVLVATRLRY